MPEPDEEPLGTPEWAIRAAQDVGLVAEQAAAWHHAHGNLSSLADLIGR